MWNSLRHEEQQRSIVGHMEKRGLLQPEYVYVEMGAGRGTLSRTLNEALPGSHIVLVERGSQRHRVDQRLLDPSSLAQGHADASSASSSFVRVRMDIAPLELR